MKQKMNSLANRQTETNKIGQPIGWPIFDWAPAAVPDGRPLPGQHCRLERLSAERHAAQLFAAEQLDTPGANWTYLPEDRPVDPGEYRALVGRNAESHDPFFYAILDAATGDATGWASLLRIDPPHGVIEVGYINFTPKLQRTRAATEAMYLLMRHVFEDLGYRRYEWKCDNLNAPSKLAAERYGFVSEGVFRQARVSKGRNRDTAWFSIIDSEWPACKSAFETWLSPENFDEAGKQRRSLSEIRAAL